MCMRTMHWSDTRGNRIRKENIGCNGLNCVFFQSHSSSLAYSVCCIFGKRILMCCRNRKKVVSPCFLHCNANSYKYMHILVCNEYISFLFESATQRVLLNEGTFLCKLYSKTMRCICAYIYMLECHCQVIKPHKNLFVYVLIVIFASLLCVLVADTLACAPLNMKIQSQ